ncbi:unnamed protein product [Brachionus calyciflorus]|uniref:Uncharacterized protein n=1 Tax=Brachionus calyciflorus TaxID=104777 RepID=A0A813MCW8_9BILA|nr:unnamed protein product [Brachionus calyciflorus]
MKFITFISFCLVSLAVVSAKREIDIELAYKLLVQDMVKQGGRIYPKADDCELNCPAGTFLTQKPNHQFLFNGCGSYNININFSILNMAEFNQCCNSHDICYEVCSETKKSCDSSFDKCLTGYCNQWAIESNWNSLQKITCSSVVKLMVLAVDNLGCSAYRSSREYACFCS